MARLQFETVILPQRIVIEAQLPMGTLVVAGASLIDSRTQGSYALDLDPSLRRVHTGDLKVYQNLALRQRAYFAPEAVALPEDAAQLRALSRLGPGQVVLATAPTPRRASAAPPQTASPALQEYVRIPTYEPERVVIEVSSEQPGYLVLTDSFYPGWRAWVDGREAEILRANYLFRAVTLAEGVHRVEFRYEPASLRRGLTITLATGTLVGALLLGWPAVVWLARRLPHAF